MTLNQVRKLSAHAWIVHLDGTGQTDVQRMLTDHSLLIGGINDDQLLIAGEDLSALKDDGLAGHRQRIQREGYSARNQSFALICDTSQAGPGELP